MIAAFWFLWKMRRERGEEDGRKARGQATDRVCERVVNKILIGAGFVSSWAGLAAGLGRVGFLKHAAPKYGFELAARLLELGLGILLRFPDWQARRFRLT